jgi:hypothetical protein
MLSNEHALKNVYTCKAYAKKCDMHAEPALKLNMLR